MARALLLRGPGAGMTGFHDLRAAGACERYQALTGFPGPGRGGSRAQAPRALDRAARRGAHVRCSATGARARPRTTSGRTVANARSRTRRPPARREILLTSAQPGARRTTVATRSRLAGRIADRHLAALAGRPLALAPEASRLVSRCRRPGAYPRHPLSALEGAARGAPCERAQDLAQRLAARAGPASGFLRPAARPAAWARPAARPACRDGLRHEGHSAERSWKREKPCTQRNRVFARSWPVRCGLLVLMTPPISSRSYARACRPAEAARARCAYRVPEHSLVLSSVPRGARMS